MLGREHHNLEPPSVVGKVRAATLLVLGKEALIGLPTDPMQDDTLYRLRRPPKARGRKGSFRVCLHIFSSSCRQIVPANADAFKMKCQGPLVFPSPSSSAFASCKSFVSNPSVNQP